MARFTLQEIEASVLLQDGFWGAAGVTRHVFLCRGERTVTYSAVHRNSMFIHLKKAKSESCIFCIIIIIIIIIIISSIATY